MRMLLAVALAAVPLGPPRDQLLFGTIVSLKPSGKLYVMKLDPSLWLTGRTASDYARQKFGSPDVPNDHITYDPDHQTFTYLVPRTANVTIVGYGVKPESVTVAELAKVVAGTRKAFEPKSPFWITVRSDRAVELNQQYVP
jgi:hypothetical protein